MSTISFLTIIRKEVTRWMRIWPQTLLPSVVTISLYFLIFGAFIGSQIRDINGFSYMEFIVPGLIMMAVITNSYTNVVSSFFGSKFQRSIEEILVSPTPTGVIIIGYCLGGILRALAVAVLVTIVSLLFVPMNAFSWPIIVLFVVLTSLLFSLAGLINGVFAKKFDDVTIVPTFVLTPLTYLGGVFYSIAALPAFWQTVSKFNPVLYLVNGFRYGFLGFSDVSVWISLGALTAFTLALFILAYRLIERGVGLRE